MSPCLPRRRLLALVLVMLGLAQAAAAQDSRFFQIGTGPAGETRFLLGGLIANAISNPPGSRDCAKGGSCGVPGLVAVAKSTGGPLDTLQAVVDRRLDAALVQADLAHWAHQGTGIHGRRKPMPDLRGIAMLPPETLHLVTRRDSGIRRIADLRGKRVSLGAADSASLIQGRLLLKAHGLSERHLRLRHLRPGPAADALAAGQLDAALIVDFQPAPAIVELARSLPIALIPIDGAPAAKLAARHPFLTAGEIAAGTYRGIDQPVPTLAVGVALVTHAGQPRDLILGITRALWHPSARSLLDTALPGHRMDPDAVRHLGIPLHEGAAAFYDGDGGTR